MKETSHVKVFLLGPDAEMFEFGDVDQLVPMEGMLIIYQTSLGKRHWFPVSRIDYVEEEVGHG